MDFLALLLLPVSITTTLTSYKLESHLQTFFPLTLQSCRNAKGSSSFHLQSIEFAMVCKVSWSGRLGELENCWFDVGIGAFSCSLPAL